MPGPNPLVNLCQLTTATTGTGTITLGAAVSGFRGSSALTDGVTYSYSVLDGTAYEEGAGVFTASGTTLARGPVQSSNANAAINLSGSAIIIVGDALSWDIGLYSPTQPASFASLTLTPTPAVIDTTDVAQAVGGSVTLPFATVSGKAAGQIVAGTSIPLGAQVSAVIGTVQRQLTANGISAAGQKVLTTTNTTNAVVGQIAYDSTTTGAIGAGNVIASIQAGVSITLTSNLLAPTVNGDTITLDPVVTLTRASTAAVGAGASITFTANATSLSSASSLYTTGDAGINGNLNVGGVSKLFGGLNLGTASTAGIGQIFSSGLANFAGNTFQVGTNDAAQLEKQGLFGWTSTTSGASGTLDTILSRAGAATLQFGAPDAASPVAQSLRFQGVPTTGSTNTAGVNASVYLSPGTGGGIGGNLDFFGAPHGAAAGTQNTAVKVLSLNGDTGAVSGIGSYTFTAATAGVVLKQGANGLCGTFIANGVTPVTVSNSNVAITDCIIISLNTVGGTVGTSTPDITTITAGVGFTVKGLTLDTSTYNYAIIKNAA